MKWRYSKEEMERYFNDPEYRRSARRKMNFFSNEKRNFRLGVMRRSLYCWSEYFVYVVSGLPSLQELENPNSDLRCEFCRQTVRYSINFI